MKRDHEIKEEELGSKREQKPGAVAEGEGRPQGGHFLKGCELWQYLPKLMEMALERGRKPVLKRT